MAASLEQIAKKQKRIRKTVELMATGEFTIPEIAKAVGVSRASIYQYLAEADNVLYTRKKRREADRQRARELYATGLLTVAEIATVMKKTVNMIHYYIR